LGLLSIAFLILAWASSKVLGPVGFIVANCCNFTFRICHNFYVIEKRNRELKTDLPSPILGLIPTRKTLVAILVSGVLCQVSEILIFSAENFQTVLVHLAIGGLCFLVTILVVLLDEPHLKNFVSRIIFKRKAE
jgi:oligosaccharide translocation protein RFT1